MIDISRAHYPVTTLGVGRRIGIWFQGCSIRCKGCVSQDTWATDPSKAIPVGALLGWCKMVAPEGPDGVTISGGEPFDQPAGLSALLDGLMIWRAQLTHLIHRIAGIRKRACNTGKTPGSRCYQAG